MQLCILYMTSCICIFRIGLLAEKKGRRISDVEEHPWSNFYLPWINRAKEKKGSSPGWSSQKVKTSNRSYSEKTSHRKHACLIACVFAPHGMDPTITTYACHVRWRRQQGLGRLVAVRRAADKGKKKGRWYASAWPVWVFTVFSSSRNLSHCGTNRLSGSSLRDPFRELARFAGLCMGLACLAGYPASGSQRHQGLYGVGGALS